MFSSIKLPDEEIVFFFLEGKEEFMLIRKLGGKNTSNEKRKLFRCLFAFLLYK